MVVYECDCCIMREEIMRERRGSYNGCVVGCIPSFFIFTTYTFEPNVSFSLLSYSMFLMHSLQFHAFAFISFAT
jgi:hypothetical protein